MKCFLHIGTEKTATTTVQDFLDLNRKKLLNNGLIYTKSAGKTDNRGLSVASYDPARRDGFTKSHEIYSVNELLNFQNKVIHELKYEIKGLVAYQPGLKLLFSSEHFQSRLTQLSEIQRLKEILYSLGVDRVLVIVYLRNPAEIANSLFSTSIKAGGIEKQPPSPKNQYYTNICNHKNTLEKFAAAFGEEALIPKVFHQTEFINRSIIDDFLGVIGLSADSSYSIPEDANKSISVSGINILRRLNEKIPRFIEDRQNPLWFNIVSYIEKHFSASKYVMPSELYEQYDKEFHESNEWVRQKYFPDKQSLFPEAAYPKETENYIPEDELDNIASIIADIWKGNSL